MIECLEEILNVKINFEEEAHSILSKEESAQSRVISIEQTRSKLKSLSLQQENLLNDALSCLQYGLFRPAHVMAWAAFFDCLEQIFASDLEKVYAVRSKWKKFTTIEDLSENVPESQLIEVAKEIKIISKNDMHMLKGDLTKRNKCAHPTDYQPDLNDTLGYVSGLLKHIEKIQSKMLSTS